MTLVAALPPAAAPARFSADLREHTKTVHRAAERAGFIADLLHGRATRQGYATFLRNLQPVYAALEAALAVLHDDPLVAPFADPGLRRLPAIEADLQALDPCSAGRSALPASLAYAETIAAAGAASLVGHAYARYLGDLSGGQILKPLLARTLGLEPGMLTLYDFPAFDDLEAPKTRLRDALDAVPVGSAAAAEIRAGAIDAFDHAIAVAEAVEAALKAS